MASGAATGVAVTNERGDLFMTPEDPLNHHMQSQTPQARKARVELEEKTGRSVVTGENFLPMAAVPVVEKMDVELSTKKVRRKGN